MSARTLASVLPIDSVYRAAGLMAEAGADCALVVDAGVVIGIITEDNVVNRVVARSLDPAQVSVGSVMTRKPICLPADMCVIHALYTMKELGFKRLPVIGPQHEPLGIFSLQDAHRDELAGADDLAYARETLVLACGPFSNLLGVGR